VAVPSPAPTTADDRAAGGLGGGRPSSKAERTREALRAAALRRFVADGFDAATVVDIAADVGVTERTFYRHFATKDEVLFGDVEQRLGWFREALQARPSTESLVDSCMAALTSFPDDPRVMLEIAKLRASLLSRDRIARYLRELQGLLADELAAVAAQRRTAGAAERDGDDADLALGPAVEAAILSAAVFAAVRVWSDQVRDVTLDELNRLTAQALDLVRPSVQR
jgi:AcrR family transcriptional regulator